MHTSKAEISKAISKLKYGKSPGLDTISTNMLKRAQNELLPSIEKLFNSIFQSETPRRVCQQQSHSDLSLSVV
jgi:hypothetical protein